MYSTYGYKFRKEIGKKGLNCSLFFLRGKEEEESRNLRMREKILNWESFGVFQLIGEPVQALV